MRGRGRGRDKNEGGGRKKEKRGKRESVDNRAGGRGRGRRRHGATSRGLVVSHVTTPPRQRNRFRCQWRDFRLYYDASTQARKGG